jgi:hypothetical protein
MIRPPWQEANRRPWSAALSLRDRAGFVQK